MMCTRSENFLSIRVIIITVAVIIVTSVVLGEDIKENERNLNADENWRKENHTMMNVTPNYVSYSQYSTYPDHTESHWSVHSNGYNKFYKADFHTTLAWDNGTISDNLGAGKAFTETVNKSCESDHLEVNVQDCGGQTDRYRIKAIKGGIHIFLAQTLDIQEKIQLFCEAAVEVPQGMVAYVKMLMTSPNHVSIETPIIKLFDENSQVLYDDAVKRVFETFVTYSSILNIEVKVHSDAKPFEIHINFAAVPATTSSQLYLNFTSPNTGFIDVSKWSGNGSYFPFIKTWLHLPAPKEHSTVVSIHHVDFNPYCGRSPAYSNDVIILQTDEQSEMYDLCSHSAYSFTEPLVSHGNISVQYKTYAAYYQTHLRIAFSFHPLSALPVRLSEYKWNCSGVHWRAIKQHFPCNFVSECVGGEDEAGCWPASDRCSSGLFQADGRCFSVVRLEGERSSWNLASRWCQQRGGLLPSLSTRTLWDSVTELLMTRVGGPPLVFIGAKSAPPTVSLPYRNSWLWSDGSVAYFLKALHFLNHGIGMDVCACISQSRGLLLIKPVWLEIVFCDAEYLASFLMCEVPASSNPFYTIVPPEITPANATSSVNNDASHRFYISKRKSAYIWCPNNHFTHLFLACDELSNCWSNKDGATFSCSAPMTSLPPPFRCAGTEQRVPYSLVCDHRSDCMDESDENFCFFPPCDVTSPFRCSGRRCVQKAERCNGQVDCDDRADEDKCRITSFRFVDTFKLQPPLKADLDSKGRISLSDCTNPAYSSSSVISCPESHFVCASLEQVCLPVYFRCNGVKDCPGHEDEAVCDSYTCPGFYRCRDSRVCVHESHLCDGVYHCPQRDDEILCDEGCPQNCVCHGWAFVCSGVFSAADYPNIRYCDASRTSMTLAHLDNSTFLVHLSLVYCNLTELHEVTLPNLRTLDLSNNQLIQITSKHFTGLTNLHLLKISFNPLKVVSFQDSFQTSLSILDMSDVLIQEIDFGVLAFFSNMTSLNLSGSQLTQVTGKGFHAMDRMRILDLRLCSITSFPRGIFKNLINLETIYADNYKLCCPATLPSGFNVLNCHALSDEVSSCDDLLRSNLYRIGFAVFASFALVGNFGSLVYRLIFHKTANKVGYDIFVTNLCVADLLMGVYLLIIGIADHRYKGVYLWEDVAWRNSILCRLAGFTCLLSSEVSVFIIFFITCDRFLVVRFPFSRIRFGNRSAQLACAVSWLAGFTLALFPLLPLTSHWKFYSQTGICIPLPTTRASFPGRAFSFGVIIILNFFFFIFILFGQIIIYMSVRANSMSAACKPSKDFEIAKRLITVAMSDILCWFPVGVTGILASYDVPISGEVNVGIAIFVLPINAALNPFLYTMNIYLERRGRAKEEVKRKRILAQLKLANVSGSAASGNVKAAMTKNDAVSLLKTLVGANILSPADLRGLATEAR